MKNTIIILLIGLSVFSQNQQIRIDTVINMKNVSKEVLYSRVHTYLTSTLNNQKQEDYLFKVEDSKKAILRLVTTKTH